VSLATLMSAHITLIGPPSDALRPGENAGSSAPLWGGPNRLDRPQSSLAANTACVAAGRGREGSAREVRSQTRA